VKRLPAISALVLLLTLLAGGATGQEPRPPATPVIEWGLISPPEQYLRLLANPRVLEDLKVAEVPESLSKELHAKALAASQSETQPGKSAPQLRECAALVEEALGKEAAQRVEQVRYQCVGLRYAVQEDPGLASDLKLTEAQQERVAALPIGGLPPRLGGADFASLRTAEAEILDAGQKRRWEALCGTLLEGRLPLMMAIKGGGNVGKVKIPVVLSGGTYGRLLVDPAIQQELKLTPPQVEKVREVIPRLQQGDADVIKENPPEVEPLRLREIATDRRDAVRKLIKEEFSPKIETRLTQLVRQHQGLLPSLRSDPEIAEMLKFTEEQNRKIGILMQSGVLPRPPRPTGTPQQVEAAFNEFRRLLDEVIVAEVLTEAQQKQWTEMSGEPYEVSILIGPFLPLVPRGPAP